MHPCPIGGRRRGVTAARASAVGLSLQPLDEFRWSACRIRKARRRAPGLPGREFCGKSLELASGASNSRCTEDEMQRRLGERGDVADQACRGCRIARLLAAAAAQAFGTFCGRRLVVVDTLCRACE